jgi:hypothetical protein
MLGHRTYCRFLWPKLQPPTWNAPSYTLVPWAYCSTYDPVWSDLACAVALVGVVAAALAHRESAYAKHALATSGLLAIRLGLPARFDAYRRHAGQRRPNSAAANGPAGGRRSAAGRNALERSRGRVRALVANRRAGLRRTEVNQR